MLWQSLFLHWNESHVWAGTWLWFTLCLHPSNRNSIMDWAELCSGSSNDWYLTIEQSCLNFQSHIQVTVNLCVYIYVSVCNWSNAFTVWTHLVFDSDLKMKVRKWRSDDTDKTDERDLNSVTLHRWFPNLVSKWTISQLMRKPLNISKEFVNSFFKSLAHSYHRIWHMVVQLKKAILSSCTSFPT